MSFLSSLMNALPGAAAQGLAWGIMAIGVYITFRILDVADLTVDGSLATGGAVCVMLIRGGFNPWIALLCAMLAGMLAGLVTGLFHTRCGIPAILAGILTQLALYSINLRIMDSKANQALSVDKYPLLLSQRYVRELSMNNPLLFTAAVIAILYWFFGTEKGSSLRATGANPHMARAQGINTNSNIVLGLMVSNGLVALSGALLAQYQGSSDINMGRGAIVIGLAAVIIGEVIFGKIFTNFGLTLLAVSIGAIIYYIVLQIVLQLGLNTNDLKLITALIVVDSLGIPITSLVALLSVGSLGITLAAEDILGNVAGGLVILSSHPFALGDFLEVGGTSGTVEEISLNHTKLITPDGLMVLLPNKELASSKMTNYTVNGQRRIVWKVSASYDAPTETVKAACEQALGMTDHLLKDPAPSVRLTSYGESAIEYTVYCWAAPADYWDAYFALGEHLRTAFADHGVEMTYNHLNVHIVENRT